MRWGTITFTPTRGQLDLLKASTPSMGSIRIQGSRSHAAADQVIRSLDDATERGYSVAWGPMDGPDDYQDLDHYVRTILSAVHDLPSLVIFDAEMKNPQYALQGPNGPVHEFNKHILPAIAVAQSFGCLTAGPGTTHTDGEDGMGLEVLENIISSPGIDPSMHTPSFHWYVDKGWKKAHARLERMERDIRMLGWDHAHITETGAHGAWLRSLDGWGCGKDKRPTEQRQKDRGEGIKSTLSGVAFFDQCFWYQVVEDWYDDPDRWYGLFDPQWCPKLVTTLWA
jgi:hypothetical protein